MPKIKILKCSFCSRTQKDVPLLIAGATGYICSGCVSICVSIMADYLTRQVPTALAQCEWSIITDKEAIDTYVSGMPQSK